MTVRVYKSTDVSAPVLTGQAGSLIAVLDACLVNGYGAKVAAGWTKPFTGTNKAVYQPGLSAPNFYRVLDDGSLGSYTTRNATIKAFTAMTDVDTGSNPSPSADSTSYVNFVPKSLTPDATTRKWKIIASEKSCYLMIEVGYYLSSYCVSFFGDYQPFNPSYSDNAGCIFANDGSAANSASSSSSSSFITNVPLSSTATNANGILVKDNNFQDSGGIWSPFSGTNLASSRNNSLVLLPYYVRSSESLSGSEGTLLGVLPGAYKSNNAIAANDTEVTFSSGTMIGKTFDLSIISFTNAITYTPLYLDITSNAW